MLLRKLAGCLTGSGSDRLNSGTNKKNPEPGSLGYYKKFDKDGPAPNVSVNQERAALLGDDRIEQRPDFPKMSERKLAFYLKGRTHAFWDSKIKEGLKTTVFFTLNRKYDSTLLRWEKDCKAEGLRYTPEFMAAEDIMNRLLYEDLPNQNFDSLVEFALGHSYIKEKSESDDRVFNSLNENKNNQDWINPKKKMSNIIASEILEWLSQKGLSLTPEEIKSLKDY